jgi:hypothetical protein
MFYTLGGSLNTMRDFGNTGVGKHYSLNKLVLFFRVNFCIGPAKSFGIF